MQIPAKDIKKPALLHPGRTHNLIYSQSKLSEFHITDGKFSL
jgi:hypothetical protein